MDAIVIKNLTKCFRKSTLSGVHSTLKSELVQWLHRQHSPKRNPMIEVLKGIDLTVPQGETFAIIGRNGSGKSTLLKLISGIYAPTSGTLEVNGRISALLELGAGMHPEFSGRENILINGIILGLSRAEVRARMAEIIDFSELGEFIDEPVRTYSSGMYMRLAFSVATHVDPDILLIDEILAVGDDHFARKSMAKMTEFKERGKTILLVTHDLQTVQRWCHAAAWIDGGRVRALGAPGDVVDRYRRAVAEEEMAQQPTSGPPGGNHSEAARTAEKESAAGGNQNPQEVRRWGNRKVEISAVRILDNAGEEHALFDTEDGLTVEMDFKATEGIVDIVFGIAVFRSDHLQVYGTNTLLDRVQLPRPLPSKGTVRLEIGRLGFIDGNYLLDVAAHTENSENYDYHRLLYQFAIRSARTDVGIARPPHRWSLIAAEATPSARASKAR
jgi:lipopolysaccharide transport system ATP-binding protein